MFHNQTKTNPNKLKMQLENTILTSSVLNTVVCVIRVFKVQFQSEDDCVIIESFSVYHTLVFIYFSPMSSFADNEETRVAITVVCIIVVVLW